MKNVTNSGHEVTVVVPVWMIGLDLGDKISRVLVMDANGKTVHEQSVRTTSSALQGFFGRHPGARVALEVGTHSPWISRLLESLGCEVIVANARKVRLISHNERKNDRMDAELLARLARVDPALLYPIRHRGATAQADLALLRARDALVRSRTRLINHVRGAVKSLGERLPGCSAPAFARKVGERLPKTLRPALEPLLAEVARLTALIRAYDRRIEALCAQSYPETARLRQVRGVGPLTALAFVLTLEDPGRFPRSRKVGPYLGLVSRRHDSADSRPQLRISKAGDAFLRRLLVSCAQYILGPFGMACDLRLYGEAIARNGGKNAKKRAVVAVARKLAVLLHALWRSGADYEPDRASAMAA
jgi:transposase